LLSLSESNEEDAVPHCIYQTFSISDVLTTLFSPQPPSPFASFMGERFMLEGWRNYFLLTAIRLSVYLYAVLIAVR
jgi:hypothetical protein